MDSLNLSGEVKLLLPEGCDLNDAKIETIQKCDSITSKITYSNGLVIESIQTADTIKMNINKELIYNEDGTVSIKM